MFKILNDKIKEMKNGLFLLDAPTGFGKTTVVLEYIYQFLSNENCDNKIFFVTNLKKNLPVEEFKKRIGEEKFNKDCLLLMSYAESVYNKWSNLKNVNPNILKKDEYITINDHIKLMQDSEFNNPKVYKFLKKQLENNIEPEFRKMIKKEFFSEENYTSRIKSLNDNPWIGQIYPIVNIDKYRVIFCSTSKFCYPFDCFYRKPFEIFDDKLIKNAIVFIDEFDEAKKVLLDKIICDGLKIDIDIINLFTNIHYALQNVSLPKRLIKISNERQKDFNLNPKLKTPKEIIEANKKIFLDIYNDYELKYILRTKNIDNDRAFLFSDGNYFTITSNTDRKKLITYIDDKDENLRIIEMVNKKFNKEQLQVLIENIEKAINHFARGMKWIAENYLFYKNSNYSIENKYYTFDEAIRSVLSIFNISEDYCEFLISLINNQSDTNDAENDEEKFYKKGISILSVENSEYHDIQSRVNMFKFTTIPEEIMLKMCNNAKVIGISATATLPTIIGNFDLDFLKKKLKENYYVLSSFEYQKIKKEFNERQKIYDNIDINVDIIDNYPIFDDKEKCNLLIDKIFKFSNGSKYKVISNQLANHYYLLIILKIAYCYNKFCEENKFRSFICFLNSFPLQKNSNKKYDRLYLDDLYEVLDDINKEKYYCILSSTDFEETLANINEKLESGNKCFVITTYQTIGVGRNIQYKIHDSILDEIYINNESYLQKDYDGILLIYPTNLIETLREETDDKRYQISKFIFQQEYLKSKKYLLNWQMKDNIVSGFRRLFFGQNVRISIKNKDLYFHTAKIIIQAVGRICRTANKNKTIRIYTDYETVERIQNVKPILENRLLNYEFKKMLEVELNNFEIQIDKYNIINFNASKDIDFKACNLRSSEENNREWEEIREYVLKYPTTNYPHEKYKMYYFGFGVKVNKYSYELKNQFHFKSIKPNNISLSREVSSEDANLDVLMQIKIIKKYFDEHGYAKTFTKGDYIMSLALYNQIYLGALGEIVGKILLEDRLGIELANISDYSMYELFDYQYEDIYFDFKHWKLYHKDRDEYVKHVLDKLNRVNGKKCFVINIMDRGIGDYSTQNQDKTIIEIPWLIKDGEIDDDQIGIIDSNLI